jgi:hypothetical protein
METVEYRYREIVGHDAHIHRWKTIDERIRQFFHWCRGKRVRLILGMGDVREPEFDRVEITDVLFSILAVQYAHDVILRWDGRERVLKTYEGRSVHMADLPPDVEQDMA